VICGSHGTPVLAWKPPELAPQLYAARTSFLVGPLVFDVRQQGSTMNTPVLDFGKYILDFILRGTGFDDPCA